MALSLLDNSVGKRVMNDIAAGTTTPQNSTGVEMTDGESVTFVALMGTITSGAVTAMHAEGSNNGSDWVDLEGSALAIPDTGSDKAFALEVVRPLHKHVRAVITRGTQNAAIDGMFAFKTHLRKTPTAHDTTVGGTKTVVGPAAGTP